jgi:hypothetical protein
VVIVSYAPALGVIVSTHGAKEPGMSRTLLFTASFEIINAIRIAEPRATELTISFAELKSYCGLDESDGGGREGDGDVDGGGGTWCYPIGFNCYVA